MYSLRIRSVPVHDTRRLQNINTIVMISSFLFFILPSRIVLSNIFSCVKIVLYYLSFTIILSSIIPVFYCVSLVYYIYSLFCI